jgi:hypothetical protein
MMVDLSDMVQLHVYLVSTLCAKSQYLIKLLQSAKNLREAFHEIDIDKLFYKLSDFD